MPDSQPREERVITNRWADDLLNAATADFAVLNEGPWAGRPHGKPHEQRQVEALHWIAGEIRALRFALAADTEEKPTEEEGTNG